MMALLLVCAVLLVRSLLPQLMHRVTHIDALPRVMHRVTHIDASGMRAW